MYFRVVKIKVVSFPFTAGFIQNIICFQKENNKSCLFVPPDLACVSIRTTPKGEMAAMMVTFGPLWVGVIILAGVPFLDLANMQVETCFINKHTILVKLNVFTLLNHLNPLLSRFSCFFRVSLQRVFVRFLHCRSALFYKVLIHSSSGDGQACEMLTQVFLYLVRIAVGWSSTYWVRNSLCSGPNFGGAFLPRFCCEGVLCSSSSI